MVSQQYPAGRDPALRGLTPGAPRPARQESASKDGEAVRVIFYQRPVDSCGECMTARHRAIAHPYRLVIDGDKTGLRAWYRCPACLYSWWTSWSIDALDLPCPGCPACTIATETAA